MTEVTAPSAAYTPFDVEQPDSISPARTFADDSEVAASQSSKLSRANSTGTEIRHGHAQSLNMGYLLEDAERRLHPSRGKLY